MFYFHRFSDVALLPDRPKTASPVPGLTSLYHNPQRGPYGRASYPGNCSGNLIKDLLLYFQPMRVLDPMSGSGTCLDVCQELGIECVSCDVAAGKDACDPKNFCGIGTFDFIWAHPPYWRQKKYTDDPRDLSNYPTWATFLNRYQLFIANCAAVLNRGGKFAILMGDYCDWIEGFVPLVYQTKRLCFQVGLKQACTDIIRFSHGATSAKKVYRSSFIPGLHDVVTVVEKVT